VGADDVGAEEGRADDLAFDLKAITHSATSDAEEHSRLPVGVV
jgi:hypothetical protein